MNRLLTLALVAVAALFAPGCCPDKAAAPPSAPATSSAAPTQAPAAHAEEWSPAVEGVRGRLILTPDEANGRPQLRVELELQNVSDNGLPIEISWGGLGSMLQLSLEDESGKVVPPAGIGGNELSPPQRWLQLPVNSSLRVTISKSAYEYVPGPAGRTLLRPVSLQAWDLPKTRGAKLFLKAKLTPLPAPADGHRPWSGPLEIPRVALPAQ
jgi:hypothetical protein